MSIWRRRLAQWTVGLVLILVLTYLVAVLVLQWSESEPALGETPESPFAGVAPDGFLWGVSTSAHQIEGGNQWSDWARFERDREASGEASGHWDRVAEDVGLIEALGANAYRFSIEWSRLEPVEGEWSEEAWEHYADEVRQLRAAGIEPMVTLLHFTLPAWLADRGGLTAEDFPQRFGRFAAEAAHRLGDEVTLWCTLNEPNVQMIQGYVEGIWPPGVRDTAQASQAFAGLVRAHAAAAAAVRANDTESSIGMAVNLIVFDPWSQWSLLDWIASRQADSGFNWAFHNSVREGRILFELAGFPPLDEPLEGLAGSTDWLGVNYYRRNMVRFDLGAPGLVELRPGPGELSDSGVEIYPEGLLRLLRRAWKRYGKPIYITENGVSDAADRLRAGYLRGHATAVARALDEGIPVRGYFHWSLLDNFEWTEGFGPRFGLYRVDYETLGRHSTRGGEEFRRLSPHKEY
jgi:beta-glucosidase